MIIGDGANKLERRITTTINTSTLTAKELSFLQAMLHRIERYRDRALLSDAQASWLYTILTRDETGASRSNIRPPKPSHPRTFNVSSHGTSAITSTTLADVSAREDEKPQGFDITDALIQG
ncbi:MULTISPECIES: hypothetical protein [unclassified Bradyrhizobium]|uniref:hypothetical protein n=1 Tax=unclassified Bradyrhizobium TaxID=2631580 RepID=UPI001FFB7CC2|nr:MULTISPECIES: hypothetical protein [unclassified Bradyrhizobium]MCK1344467.1 hypothetical protein [Bradyrhizobium sp. CW11]MCK1591047.1 hypothetical protein [Bradyrhizobium sp. 169]